MFGGRTWEGGSCEEKNADSAGNRGSPLNGCLGEEGRADEKASRHHPVCHPRVRSLLSKCGPSLHNRRQEVWGGNARVWNEGER